MKTTIIMLRRIFMPLLIPVLFACNAPEKQANATVSEQAADTTAAKPLTPEQLISPGKGIGHLTINMDADSAIKVLGRPDSSDAAMGSALMTWYADHKRNGYKTSIFAHRNMGGADENISYIKKILVTSPWFKTAEGVSTGLPLKEIEKHYSLKPVADYSADQKKIKVFDDNAKGIMFDVNSESGKCVAITVYLPGEGTGTYLNIH